MFEGRFSPSKVNKVSERLGTRFESSSPSHSALLACVHACSLPFPLPHTLIPRPQIKSHGDRAIFVHMYGPEPHPCAPDTNFDSGKLLSNYWSVAPQTFTYKGRLQAARAIREITHPDQVT